MVDMSTSDDLVNSEDLKEFVVEIKAGNDEKAAEIYARVRKASIEEARLVVKTTKELFS